MNFVPASALSAVAALLLGPHLSTSYAQTNDVPLARTMGPRPLNVNQLSAIRSVGHHVLAAKRSGTEDGGDAEQLTRLRASLDALIAADLDPKNRTAISVQGQESSEQGKARAAVDRLRESARADGLAVAAQLRQRGEVKTALSRTQPERATLSSGLPIGAQRAQLFERWASQLEAALVEGNEERTGKLRELRAQLQSTKGGLAEVPRTHGTPTLQAMPAGYVSPKLPMPGDGAAKE